MLLLEPPHVGARPHVAATELAVEHRPAGHHDRGQVHARCGHEHCRGGLVAAGEQHDCIQGIGPQQLLDFHRHEVAEQHGGRPHERFTKRHRRELEREAACLPDASLDRISDASQMRVARRQLGPAVGDADNGPSVKYLPWEPLRLQPGPVDHPRSALSTEPGGAAKLTGRSGAWLCCHGVLSAECSRCSASGVRLPGQRKRLASKRQ